MYIKKLILEIFLLVIPLLAYLIISAYYTKFSKKTKEKVLQIALLVSVALILVYHDYFKDALVFMLFINIPLLISYLKKYKYLSIILSFVIVYYYCYLYHLNIYFISFEYLGYYIIYGYVLKNKLTYLNIINTFTIIKGLLLSFQIYNLITVNSYLVVFITLFVLLSLFYILSLLTITLLNKGEDMMNVNSIMHELEKEKTIRKSLFQITHEIKNPIAVCKGYLSMMDYKDINKVERYNNIITSEINRTLTILDEFSEYSKVKVNLDIIDINMLLEDVSIVFDGYLKAHKVKKVIDVKDKEIFINADYDKLKQVILNMIKNSVEAIEDKGEVEIKVKEKPNKVLVVIKDNGKGMDKETLDKVSETFFTTKKQGTGLGVSLSKEIIDLHKGILNYDSELGKGTTVTISLPKLNLKEAK